MKLIITLALLIITVIVCEKFEDKLFPPVSWVFAIWKKFSHLLGIVMSSLILSVLWTIGIGLYALLYKLGSPFRKKPLSDTYWIDIPTNADRNLRHQF